jgi:hypothetical protein
MISARRMRERAAAAAAGPVTVAQPLTEAEFLQQRFRAKQEAAKVATQAKAEEAPVAQPESAPAPVTAEAPQPEAKAEEADRRGGNKNRGR